jgi:hypothetical protein
MLRDGEVWARETGPQFWTISWYPHRHDHPDWPGHTTDSSLEAIPAGEGTDAVLAWARERFDRRDARDLIIAHLEAEASDEDLRAIERVFDEAGTPAIVHASIERRSVGDLPWAILITAPLAAFLAGLGAAAGNDAWRALKAFVHRVYEVRRRPDRADGAIRVDDGARTVILSEAMPDEAYERLAAGELSETGYYVWDTDRGCWRRY